MGIALPVYGIPGFTYNEDEYNLWGESSGFTIGENELAPQEVVITCKHKNGRVSGLLREGVKLDGKAEWTEMFGGGIMSLGGTMVETANNLMQFVKASSIQQPWMNRKMWKTTKPFSFQIPLSFVATTDALNEVVRPAMALMSFIFPRELKTKDGDDASAYTGLNSATKGKMGQIFGENGLVGTALTSFQFYNIPGPGIRYDGNDNGDEIGDPVTIVIGKMFAFGACYLESVKIEFSSAMNSEGYPIAATVDLTATVMDACTCQTDGNFLIQEFYGSSENLNAFIDKFQDTTTQLGADFKNIIDKTIGFWKQTGEAVKGGLSL